VFQVLVLVSVTTTVAPRLRLRSADPSRSIALMRGILPIAQALIALIQRSRAPEDPVAVENVIKFPPRFKSGFSLRMLVCVPGFSLVYPVFLYPVFCT